MNSLSAILAASIGITLVACAQREAPTQAQGSKRAQESPQKDVYPSLLRDTDSMEFGKLILMLMPTSAQQIGWDFYANSAVQWQTSGYGMYPTVNGGAYRRGWLRVNILGAKATVLRQHTVELGWTVELDRDFSQGFAGIRSGPNEVAIKPGGDGSDDQCFGPEFDGCDFDAPIDSVAIAGIHVQVICTRFAPDEGEEKSAFLLTYPGRRPTVMLWERSGGSGGDSSNIELILDAVSKIHPAETGGYNFLVHATSYSDQALCADKHRPLNGY